MYLRDSKVLPVIQTWEPDQPYNERLYTSFAPHKHLFLYPLFEIDETDQGISYDYMENTIKKFNPFIDLFQGTGLSVFDRVCAVGMAALRSSLYNPVNWDYILYMEGDIVLSRHFDTYWNAIQVPENLGLLTFYTPGYEYESPNRNINSIIYQFPGQRFYGIQCVLFPRDIVEDIVKNESSLVNLYQGYNDIRWKEYLLAKGRDFWCTGRSMAQHIGLDRPHRAPSNPHTSSTFYD